MSPSTARNLNRSAVVVGGVGVLLWLGVVIATVAWPTPASPLSMADLAAISARTSLLGRLGLAGFVLIQFSNSLSAIANPRVGRRMLGAGLVLLWVGMIGLLDLLPGLWVWYCAPMIIGSFIINDVVPRSIQWLRGGRDKPETVS
ncbi:hypothetical protein [Brevundimonas naejangsanensis]|uniref:hypothetical protein n=1 Tax=Brevundimonas naejangsanensis TaxID=588932 RepID=UPI003D05E9D1